MDPAHSLLVSIDGDLEARLVKAVDRAMACLHGESRAQKQPLPYGAFVEAVHSEARAGGDVNQLTFLWLVHLWGNRKIRKHVIDTSSDRHRLDRLLRLVDVALPSFIVAAAGSVHDVLGDPTLRRTDALLPPVYPNVAALVAGARLCYTMS